MFENWKIGASLELENWSLEINMERFLIPTIILTLIFYSLCLYILLRVPPDSPLSIFYFLSSLFLALSLSLSLILYFVRLLFTPGWQEPGFIFRTSLRPAALASLAIIAYLLLRLLSAANLFNTILLLAIAVLVEIYLRRLR